MKYFGALFMAMLLVLAACGSDDNNMGEMEAEPIKMKGFFSSIDENDMDDCQDEDLSLYVDDETVDIGNANIRALSSGDVFGEATFGHVGIKTMDRIVTSYVTRTEDGGLKNPGVYFLRKVDDMYVGFWAGEALRPMDNPVVVCPYVLVPADMAEEAGCEAAAYANYLKNEDGSLKACTSAPNASD